MAFMLLGTLAPVANKQLLIRNPRIEILSGQNTSWFKIQNMVKYRVDTLLDSSQEMFSTLSEKGRMSLNPPVLGNPSFQ